MGSRTKKGSDAKGKYIEVPGNGYCWAKGWWRTWTQSGYRYQSVICGKFGEPNQKILVPEYLLDRRGHNTNVLHAKYLQYTVDLDVKGPYPWMDDWLVGGDFVVTWWWDGTHESWNVVEEDEKYVTFERVLAWYGTSTHLTEGGVQHTKWSKHADGSLQDIVYAESYTDTWYPRYFEKDPSDVSESVQRVREYIGSHSNQKREYGTNLILMDIWPLQEVIVKSKASNPACAFLLGEVGHETRGRELISEIYPAMREAYKDGVSTFPKQADNNIANFIEIGEMIFDALHGDLSSVPETLGGLWMWYRYQYSTTKADVLQAMDYWDRLKDGIELGAKYHGRVNARAAGVDVEVRWSGEVALNTDDMAALMSHRLWSAGIEPTLYTGWDLVPFSFVADWFLDIGDRLEDMDNERHAYADYNVNNSCYSFHYVRELSDKPVDCYYRFYHPPVQADGECFYSSKGTPSIATWLNRAGDSFVLTGADQKLQFRTIKL